MEIIRFGEIKMSEKEMSLAPLHRLIKKAGAYRVSETAADELRGVLEDLAVQIAREAMDYCVHAGRKTVKKEDIELAVKKLLRE
jgi:histone H3/H4